MNSDYKVNVSYKKHRKCPSKQVLTAFQWLLEQLFFPKLGVKPTSWNSAEGNSRKQLPLTEGKHIAKSWLVITCLFSRKGLLLRLSSEHSRQQNQRCHSFLIIRLASARFGTFLALCLLVSRGSAMSVFANSTTCHWDTLRDGLKKNFRAYKI